MYIYIYIYIYSERERGGRERLFPLAPTARVWVALRDCGGARGRTRNIIQYDCILYNSMYIYIYIYIYNNIHLGFIDGPPLFVFS